MNLSLTNITDTPIPITFALHQNYPNPFNVATKIEYDLVQECNVKIDIFDIDGNRIATLVRGPQQSGHHQVIWDAAGNPSGVYTVLLK